MCACFNYPVVSIIHINELMTMSKKVILSSTNLIKKYFFCSKLTFSTKNLISEHASQITFLFSIVYRISKNQLKNYIVLSRKAVFLQPPPPPILDFARKQITNNYGKFIFSTQKTEYNLVITILRKNANTFAGSSFKKPSCKCLFPAGPRTLLGQSIILPPAG